MKKIFMLLMILTSVAVFGQESGDTEENTPSYLGVSFGDILGKATKITDLMLKFDYKIIKEEGKENIYFSEVNENCSLSFFTDDNDYVRGIAEIKYFDNVVDVLDDASYFFYTEQTILTFSLIGRETFVNAVKSFLKSGQLDLKYEMDNTMINYRLANNSGEYVVTKIYLIDDLIF